MAQWLCNANEPEAVALRARASVVMFPIINIAGSVAARTTRRGCAPPVVLTVKVQSAQGGAGPLLCACQRERCGSWRGVAWRLLWVTNVRR